MAAEPAGPYIATGVGSGANRVRSVLAAGRPALGACVHVPGPVSAELLAAAGYDWLMLDLQHGGMTIDGVAPVIAALAPSGTAPLVRVGWNEEAAIMRALDLGAAGVIVPMVETAAEAERAAAACRYPPRGNRSYGPLREPFGDVEGANREVFCMPMIETRKGLEEAEEIVAVAGVDAIFIGAVDLGLSLGAPFATPVDQEPILGAIRRVRDAAARHGVELCVIAGNREQAEMLVAEGVRLPLWGFDLQFIRAAAEAQVAAAAAIFDRAGEGEG
jgi:4-hydroxy-2-oxoheptanedioate aldolase